MKDTKHYARIEASPGLEWNFELVEYSGGEKVGVVGGFHSKKDARKYTNENFDRMELIE